LLWESLCGAVGYTGGLLQIELEELEEEEDQLEWE
jgi:hypothetical protein